MCWEELAEIIGLGVQGQQQRRSRTQREIADEAVHGDGFRGRRTVRTPVS